MKDFGDWFRDGPVSSKSKSVTIHMHDNNDDEELFLLRMIAQSATSDLVWIERDKVYKACCKVCNNWFEIPLNEYRIQSNYCCQSYRCTP